MTKVKVEHQGNVSLVRLDGGITNAIDTLMLDDLSTALDQAQEKSGAMVLAGNAKFFSMGFNLPALLPLDRGAMGDFFYKFNQVVLKLLSAPFPTVCAIAGHAVAGGNILTLACDYRIAGERKKLGLNEVLLGVPVPYLADLMLRRIVPDRAAKEMVYQGSFISAADAKQVGLIDDLCSQDDVEEQAIMKAAGLAALPRPAFAAVKANGVEAVVLPYERHAREKNELFLDCWFDPGTQELLKEAARKF
jgi:enoyl-CoA hydratase/carnithine racemase